MIKYNFVTSFSPTGYEQYGKRFLETFVKHFPKEVILCVFHEGAKPDIEDPRLFYYDLREDKDLTSFQNRHKNNAYANGIVNLADGSQQLNYRFQATKFVNKVASLTSNKMPSAEWLIWIDADIIVEKDIPRSFFDELLSNKEAIAYYIGRPEDVWHHSECGFVAYNTERSWTKNFLAEFRAAYMEDKIFQLQETHDSFVFDVLRKTYELQGARFVDIAAGLREFHPWPKTRLGEYMVHLKGPVAKEEANKNKTYDIAPKSMKTGGRKKRTSKTKDTPVPIAPPIQKPTPPQQVDMLKLLSGCANRYEQIKRIVDVFNPFSIVEIGTGKGNTAVPLCESLLARGKMVQYTGFDLFDDITPEISARELNSKPPVKMADVVAKLKVLTDKYPNSFKANLIKGDTNVSLKEPGTLPAQIDLAIIDGGNSIETIQNAYNALAARTKLIIMDDYFVEGVDTSKFGCNTLVNALSQGLILPTVDGFPNGTKVAMVALGPVITATNIQDGPPVGKTSSDGIKIKTRNCVEDEVIQANLKHAFTYTEKNIKTRLTQIGNMVKEGKSIEDMIRELTELNSRKPVKWVPRACAPTNTKLVIIGGSGSTTDTNHSEYKSNWEHIKKLYDRGYKVVGVKTSYDIIREHNIIPWACLLLDPRDHVANSIKNPHKDTIYFIASMCHPTTWDKFAGGGFECYGYHAGVNAGEAQVILDLWGNGPDDSNIIHGGTTSGFRGLSLLYALGFRSFTMFGFDSSYENKPEKVHGRSPKPAVHAGVNGKEFWTDPELIAQSQDMEFFLKTKHNIDIKFVGNGMLQHACNTLMQHFKNNPGDRTKLDGSLGCYLYGFKANDEIAEALHIENALLALQERFRTLKKMLNTLPSFDSFINT